MSTTQQKERRPRAPKTQTTEKKVETVVEDLPKTAVIKTPSGRDLNIRSAKGHNDAGEIITTFKNGSKVTVLNGKQTQIIAGKQQDMTQVKQGKTVGFCVAAYLEINQ